MANIDVSAYDHSPVHKAIVSKDYKGLEEILAGLPILGNPYEITTEAASIAEEERANAISAVINRRDVPNGDTPLHLAAKLGDDVATKMLMIAGANDSLKNKQGWSALREAIIDRQDKIAMIMIKHSWNDYDEKWHRRLPRYVGTMRRMRDFYMEITFHFESSVIPFISRIAPSDTYKIWKRGANMRADMTMAGFDGLKIKRSDQSILFLGDGLDDEKKVPGSLCMISHKKKEVIIASSTGGSIPTEREVRQAYARKCRAKVVRIGIDVSQALLVPQLTWRRKERKEMVGQWKSQVYDMQNVVLSVKSKRVPGDTTTDAKFSCNTRKKDNEKIEDILTEEERKQLEDAMNSSELNNEVENGHKNKVKKEKKGKSGGHREKNHHKGKNTNASSVSSDSGCIRKDENGDSEYKRGMRPVLWLSPQFPLKIEELLPLLDILAEKVKAVRRLRELLTTKIPKENFPVRVAIPVVSTVRVLVTFTKFEELQQVDEFESAPSSPTAEGQDNPEAAESSSSWFQWIKAPSRSPATDSSSKVDDSQDPFKIPSDYTWITIDAKMKQKKNKPKPQKS